MYILRLTAIVFVFTYTGGLTMFDKIDWALLRKQKEELIDTISFSDRGEDSGLVGLLHLVDSIQDYACDELGIPDVFAEDKLSFVCPNCKGKRLEEVMSDVSVTSEITNIREDGDLDYGEQVNDGGEVAQYQCVKCGFFVGEGEGGPVTDCAELAQWVKKNCRKDT
jgi:rubredoxin